MAHGDGDGNGDGNGDRVLKNSMTWREKNVFISAKQKLPQVNAF